MVCQPDDFTAFIYVSYDLAVAFFGRIWKDQGRNRTSSFTSLAEETCRNLNSDSSFLLHSANFSYAFLAENAVDTAVMSACVVTSL
jgi:hypothetical protein